MSAGHVVTFPTGHPSHATGARAALALALPSLALFALVIAAFAPALSNGFVWDDAPVILESDRLHHASAVWEVFRHPAMWSRDLPAGSMGTYRPVSLASFVVDYQLYGGRPRGFHLTSVLLHALAAVAVFRLFSRLLRHLRPAFVVAGLFALHPANAEAVAWINGRSEVFALLFGTCSLGLAASRPFRGRSMGIGLLTLAALLSKETGVVFVPLGLLIASTEPSPEPAGDPAFGQFHWRGLHGPTMIALASALGGYLILRALALAGATIPRGIAWSDVMRALPALWMRASQAALVPTDQAPTSIGIWLRDLPTVEVVGYAAAAVIVVALLVGLLRRRQHLAVFGFLWWLGALVPVALVVTSSWPGLARWLYIGLPGLLLGMFAVGLHRLRPRIQGTIAIVAAGALLVRTEMTIPVWKSGETLFTTMIAESPRDPFAYQALGAALLRDRDVARATAMFEEAYRRGSRGSGMLVHLAVGRALIGKCDEAVHLYQGLTAPEIPPEEFLETAGRCYLKAGRIGDALESFRSCAARSTRCAHMLDRFAPAAQLPAPMPPSSAE